VREDVVRSVAGITGGADDEALFQKPLSVDAFGVIFKNVGLMDLSLLLNGGPFAVAGPAQERDPQG
jgi:hypothetical protein